MQDLQGKWALVTGASRGVGSQIAKGLAEKGVNLILHGRTIENSAATENKLTQYGVKVHKVAAELSDLAQIDRMLAEVNTITHSIDILYNNAAIMTPWREPFEATSKEYQASFDVNVIALIRICNALIPPMIERGFGRVINVTSGIKDQPQLLPYAISKAAVDKYVRDLIPAVKGTGVYVNLLDPGWVRTDLGGDKAPDPVESVLPGVLVPALLEEEIQGHFYCAQDYK